MANMDARMVGLVAAMAAFQIPLSTWKWSRALYQHELAFSLRYLFQVCSGGFFLNNFLPTGVGGDAYRILKTLPPKGKRSRAISAALFDRVVGLISLLLIAYLCALSIYSAHQYAIIDQLFLPVTLALLMSFILLLGCIVVLPKMGGLKSLLSNSKRLAPLGDNMRLLASRPSNIAYIIVLAVGYQLMAISMIYLLFAATGQSMDFAVCAIITAVGGVLIMLPISIAGLGVYEGALVGSAVLFGADIQAAIAVSLCWRLLTTCVSLACGMAFLLPERSSV